MRNYSRLPSSLVKLCLGASAILAVSYIALIAVIMNYAAVTIEFSQSVRNDESAVAALEAEYLAAVARISETDYAAAGYATPIAKRFVPAKSVTAVR